MIFINVYGGPVPEKRATDGDGNSLGTVFVGKIVATGFLGNSMLAIIAH